MKPDHEYFFHVTEGVSGSGGRPAKCYFLIILHKGGNHMEQREAMASPSVCS